MASGYYSHQGWNTTSNDYHAHLERLERSPTVIHYPNVHRAFKNNFSREEQDEEQHKPSNKPGKKVQISEYVERIEEGRDGNYEVHHESIDVQAESFIRQKHKGFELCKWKTFKFQ